MKKNFTCPKCNAKISFKEVFSFSKNHITVCEHCKTELQPTNVKSWNWGFVFGFVGVIVPSNLILRYYKNFPLAVLIGVVTGAIAVLGVALYTYLNTNFKEKD